MSKEEQNIHTQVDFLRSYANSMDWKISNLYIDEGLTGRSSKRPRYRAMLEDIENNWIDYDIVLFKELSRISRDRIELDRFRKLLERYDKEMISATQQIDTKTPTGRFIFNILCDIAEYESDWISQRTRDGLQERRKLGMGKRGPDKIPRKKRLGG